MKEWSLLIWLPQVGISVVFPLIGFFMGAVWLQERFALGNWILWIGIFFGLFTSAIGVRDTIKAMDLIHKDKSPASPPISFNNHD